MADITNVLKILPDVSEMLYQMYKDETDKESISVRYDQYLAVDDAIELLKEQQPMKPVYDCPLIKCPKCKNSIDVLQKYCDECGQAIDWSKDGEQE